MGVPRSLWRALVSGARLLLGASAVQTACGGSVCVGWGRGVGGGLDRELSCLVVFGGGCLGPLGTRCPQDAERLARLSDPPPPPPTAKQTWLPLGPQSSPRTPRGSVGCLSRTLLARRPLSQGPSSFPFPIRLSSSSERSGISSPIEHHARCAQRMARSFLVWALVSMGSRPASGDRSLEGSGCSPLSKFRSPRPGLPVSLGVVPCRVSLALRPRRRQMAQQRRQRQTRSRSVPSATCLARASSGRCGGTRRALSRCGATLASTTTGASNGDGASRRP